MTCLFQEILREYIIKKLYRNFYFCKKLKYVRGTSTSFFLLEGCNNNSHYREIVETQLENNNPDNDGMSDFSEESNTEFSSSECEERNEEVELENNNFDAAYAPLYRDTPLTISDSMLLVLSSLLHHNVTMQCLADIIMVINLHCALDG